LLQRFLTYYLFLNCYTIAFSQAPEGDLKKRAFVSNPSMELKIGSVYGIHPNLRNQFPQGYYFFEGVSSATFAGLPLNLNFRNSNEELRFGRASFFKLSFDSQKFRELNVSQLQGKIAGVDGEIDSKSKALFGLESKLSYLYQKKVELENKLKLNKPNLPKLNHDSLALEIPKPDTLPKINAFEISDTSLNFKELNKYNLDSLNAKIQGYQTKIGDLSAILKDLKAQKQKLQELYSKSVLRKATSFLSGIKKFDIGLTTLSKSSMSKNSIPLHGVHFQYERDKYFTDFAAGYTLPNQLFSNQAFDQIVYNSGNIFNQGNFFQVKNIQFVSSAKVGYGKEAGNHLAVENFYTGPFIAKLDQFSKAEPKYTTNVTSKYTPNKIKNLTWINTIGYTWNKPADSLKQLTDKVSNHISLFSNVVVDFPKMRSNFDASFRRIPSSYDGLTQGIFLSQTDRIEFGYKQIVTRNFRTSIKVVRDNFYLQTNSISSRQIDQATLDMQLKLTKHLVMTSSYSLLAMKDRSSEQVNSPELSHLGRLGINTVHEILKNVFTTNHDVSYAQINGFDSVQTLTQVNSKLNYELKRVKFGCAIQYSNFKGLTRIYGQNWLIQPEFGIKVRDFTVSVAYQKLWSEQFKNQQGFTFRTHFSFFKNLDFDLSMQRFLPTEYVLFTDKNTDFKKPFYLKFSTNIHLK
jgi:hypothetical protein